LRICEWGCVDKFGSEVYGEINRMKEGEVVWTAAIVTLIGSLIVAVPMFVLSPWFRVELDVPEKFHAVGSIGLKVASLRLSCQFL